MTADAQLFSRGPLVELLIASQVARYLEFKSLDRTFLRVRGGWERVPSSKEDVFQTTLVNVVEKRQLMKFLTFCLAYQSQPDEYAGTRSGHRQASLAAVLVADLTQSRVQRWNPSDACGTHDRIRAAAVCRVLGSQAPACNAAGHLGLRHSPCS